MNRLHNLDYLRGLAAFSIMIYHYSSWSFGSFSAGTVMGRIGLYGVSIFYILSGLTLALVYQKRMELTFISLSNFALKRYLRIMPLFWLVLLFTFIIRGFPGWNRGLLLNITGLFGIVDWNTVMVRGGWSIACEIAFYCMFPFLIISYKRFKPLFWFILSSLLVFYVWNAFWRIDKQNTLIDEWWKYVHPLNQALLFALGIWMGFTFKKISFKNNVLAIILFMSCLLFIFYPTEDDIIVLVTDWTRMVFTGIVILICFCFFKISYELPTFLHQLLKILGESSYSVYLIHPIVWMAAEIIIKKFDLVISSYLLIGCCMALSLLISYFVYRYFELYFIEIGKRVTSRWEPKLEPAL